MHHMARHWPCPKLTENRAVGYRIADRNIEPEAHRLVDVPFQHSALNLIAQFVQQLFDTLAAEIGWIAHTNLLAAKPTRATHREISRTGREIFGEAACEGGKVDIRASGSSLPHPAWLPGLFG